MIISRRLGNGSPGTDPTALALRPLLRADTVGGLLGSPERTERPRATAKPRACACPSRGCG